MSGYLLVKFAHLLTAAFFIGGVFFEVMILSKATPQLSTDERARLSKALGARARVVMHWVVLVLFGAGIWLAWQYRTALAAPLDSSFAILLTLKITVAVSILLHFLAVVHLLRNGRMTPRISRAIHISVLLQMIIIVFLAKAMFLVTW